MRTPRPGNQSGFTLVEVTVVLIILALMGALAVPAFRRWVEDDELTGATRVLEALFRLARDSAIASGTPVVVWIDSASSGVWLTTASEVGSPPPATAALRAGAIRATPGKPLELPGAARIELSKTRARFRFAPSGAVFADSLVIRTPMAVRLITLHPWTGDVLY
jgi:prepilin-type N-terminal cleavage/methylation domain-containing protein